MKWKEILVWSLVILLVIVVANTIHDALTAEVSTTTGDKVVTKRVFKAQLKEMGV